jgi:hypothetical protein
LAIAIPARIERSRPAQHGSQLMLANNGAGEGWEGMRDAVGSSGGWDVGLRRSRRG